MATGGAAAGKFRLGPFILTIIGRVLAHAASNLLNDYWDWKHGVDCPDSPRVNYGPHPIASGIMGECRAAAVKLTARDAHRP